MGNPNTCIVLRGSYTDGPNYTHVKEARTLCEQHHIRPLVMVDTSHGNSNKDPGKQHYIIKYVMGEDSDVMGFMIESNLRGGNQSLADEDQLQYGVSITDKCSSWED